VLLLGGTAGGTKTSLTLPEDTIPLAKAHAARAGVTMSAWIDRAVRNLAAEEDAKTYEAWRETRSDEDKAIEAALDDASQWFRATVSTRSERRLPRSSCPVARSRRPLWRCRSRHRIAGTVDVTRLRPLDPTAVRARLGRVVVRR
jgi:hypothetical protein